MQNIAVIGAGYVGLVTGACLAQKNNVIVIVATEPCKLTCTAQSLGLGSFVAKN